MSQIKLLHSGGNGVILAAPASNPASDRTITLPSTASGNLLTSTSGSSIQVLEQFYSPCDGSIIATYGGNITLENVTAKQQATTSFVDMTGSSITYTPPSGTTQVIYRFQFVSHSDGDDNGILSCGFYVDGNLITDARTAHRHGNQYYNKSIDFTWGINIGGSTSTATGRLASWTSGKVLKIQISEYGGNNEAQVHYTNLWGTSGIDAVRRPCIGITAIGVPS